MAFRTVPWSGRWVALRDSQTTLTLCSSRGRVYNGAERLQPPRNPQFGALEPGPQHPAHGMPGPNRQKSWRPRRFISLVSLGVGAGPGSPKALLKFQVSLLVFGETLQGSQAVSRTQQGLLGFATKRPDLNPATQQKPSFPQCYFQLPARKAGGSSG